MNSSTTFMLLLLWTFLTIIILWILDSNYGTLIFGSALYAHSYPKTRHANVTNQSTSEDLISRTSKPRLNVTELPDDEFMASQQRIQDARKQHLRAVCEQYHKKPNDPVTSVLESKGSKEMLVDTKHKIVMCFTAKVAGKSWKRVLNVLTGLSNSTMQYLYGQTVSMARKIPRLRSFKPQDLPDIYKNYTFVMFARNPLTRTLSAFNNKMSPNSTDVRFRKEFWKTGKKIIKTYRPKSRSAHDKTGKYDNYDLSFVDFVKFLADQKNPQSSDNHWIPNYYFCSPCDIPYDVIGKYETLLEDAKYILKLTNVDDIVSFPETEGPKADSTHSSDHEKMWAAYKNVPMDYFTKLVEQYKMDYLLFNYTYPSIEYLFQFIDI